MDQLAVLGGRCVTINIFLGYLVYPLKIVTRSVLVMLLPLSQLKSFGYAHCVMFLVFSTTPVARCFGNSPNLFGLGVCLAVRSSLLIFVSTERVGVREQGFKHGTLLMFPLFTGSAVDMVGYVVVLVDIILFFGGWILFLSCSGPILLNPIPPSFHLPPGQPCCMPQIICTL